MDVEVFGRKMRLGEQVELSSYPLFYQHHYRVFNASLFGVQFLLVSPVDKVVPAQLCKVVENIEREEGLRCLVSSREMTPVQRRMLTSRGVAWYLSDKTFWIPFLASSSDAADYLPRPKRLSPMAQRVCLHIIDRSWNGITTTEVAEKLHRTVASAGNYIGEIERAVPGLFKTHGRARYIHVGDMSSREVYAQLASFLETPVKIRHYLRVSNDVSATLLGYPISGITALSELTDITDDPWKTYAVPPGTRIESLFAEGEAELVEECDSPDVLVESWSYDPEASEGIVNKVGLLLCCRDLAARGGDERLEFAVTELERMVLDERTGI